MKPYERLSLYRATVLATKTDNRNWRLGQTYFNVLYFGGFDSEYADAIRGSSLDPFYDDGRIPEFLEAVKRHWQTEETD